MRLTDAEKRLNALGRKVLKANAITEQDITDFNTLRGGPRDSEGLILWAYLETNQETRKPLVSWIRSERWKLLTARNEAALKQTLANFREVQEACKAMQRAELRRNCLMNSVQSRYQTLPPQYKTWGELLEAEGTPLPLLPKAPPSVKPQPSPVAGGGAASRPPPKAPPSTPKRRPILTF